MKQRRENKLLNACTEALNIIYWMSGSDDFARYGKAHKGWIKAQNKIGDIHKAITLSTIRSPRTG